MILFTLSLLQQVLPVKLNKAPEKPRATLSLNREGVSEENVDVFIKNWSRILTITPEWVGVAKSPEILQMM